MSNRNVLPLIAHRLITLADMFRFNAQAFDTLQRCLEIYQRLADDQLKLRDPCGNFPQTDKDNICELLDKLRPYCVELGMSISLHYLNMLGLELTGQTKNQVCSYQTVEGQLRRLLHAVWEELGQKSFAFIPQNVAKFVEQEALFGGLVNKAFPSAVVEIKDAGNCLAAGLHTAAVFHFMRTVEHGLRALAARLKVKLSEGLKYADWQALLRGIDKKLAELEQTSRGKKKAEALAFYRQAKDDCNMFKDVWRNSVMHTRGRYNETEALAVHLRVQGFMQLLSTRLSES